MRWSEYFFDNIALEEVESPPWDGWSPILARGGSVGDDWGFWLNLFFFWLLVLVCLWYGFNTLFFAFWGQYSRQKCSNLAKILGWTPYHDLKMSRVHPQQHKLSTNITTIKMKSFAPPVSSDVDSMNQCRLSGRRPCAYIIRGHQQRILLDSLNWCRYYLIYISLCVFLNWVCPPATMVAKTAPIVTNGSPCNTNRLFKHKINIVARC